MLDTTYALGRYFSATPGPWWKFSRRFGSSQDRLVEFCNLLCAREYSEEERLPKLQQLVDWGLWSDYDNNPPYGKGGRILNTVLTAFNSVSLVNALETRQSHLEGLRLHIVEALSPTNSTEFIDTILKSDFSVNSFIGHRLSAPNLLVYCIEKKYENWISALIEHPEINLNQCDDYYNPPLYVALSNPDQEWGTSLALRLLDKGAAPQGLFEGRLSNGKPHMILWEAIDRLNVSVFQALIDKEVDLSLVDSQNCNALHVLADSDVTSACGVNNQGHFFIKKDSKDVMKSAHEILDLLIYKKVPLFQKNDSDHTAFDMFLNFGNLSLARKILEAQIKEIGHWPMTQQDTLSTIRCLLYSYSPEKGEVLDFFELTQSQYPEWKKELFQQGYNDEIWRNLAQSWQSLLERDGLQEDTVNAVLPVRIRPRL